MFVKKFKDFKLQLNVEIPASLENCELLICEVNDKLKR